jgi:type IV pilus assembly protein PilO
MLNELRDLDYSDIGSAPTSVRYIILSFLLIIILVVGYFLLIKAKTQQLESVQKLELSLRAEFEQKQSKAANLEAYEAQLAEMQELLETMFRQLPSRTEMDKLLVDVSQTALGAGIDVQLSGNDGRLILEGTVKTYRYIDEEEAAQRAQAQAGAK